MRSAWVYFPGAPYTQECASRAAQKVLGGAGGWSVAVGASDERPSPCHLYLADYDCIPFEELHPGEYSRDEGASTSSVPLPQLSCYCIRKALIRKNYLANCLHLARIKKRSNPSYQREDDVKQISPLVNSSFNDGEDENEFAPRTWVFEATSAEDLDELLADELYDMRDELVSNEAKEPKDRTWYILKPAMADRGMGIRLLDTIDTLQAIFEGFEEEEDDDDDDDDDEEEEEEEEEEEGGGKEGEEDNEASKSVSHGASTTAIVTSQLRHFVIQEYIPRPLLIQAPGLDSPHKFHIRAYVLAQGDLKVYLWDSMLALFAPTRYKPPSSQGDLSCHLTNTCLQEDQVATVHLLQDLVGSTFTNPSSQNRGQVDLAMIDQIRSQVGSVVAQTFRACASADRINFQPWPYAWEIFGVDLLVELLQASPQTTSDRAATKVWLLEVNAQPDFGRSGDALQSTIQSLFERTLELTVLGQSTNAASVGVSSKGMTLCLDMPMSGSAR